MSNKTGITQIDDYCSGVASGRIPACKWVRLAVDRHYRDMAAAGSDAFPYVFIPAAAEHFFEFCGELKHYEGEFNRQPLVLEPWQKFVFGSIFAWIDPRDNTRRFREGNIEIPKKNGKSMMAAAIAIYGLDWDDEPGAQIYNLATSRMHAMKLSYRTAELMIENDPVLSTQFTINKSLATMRIVNRANAAFFEPLTSKPDSLDGFNVHMGINDETKDWDDLDLYQVIKDGTASRRQPFILNITTAGTNKNSLGWERREYLIKVLENTIDDESFFGIIYTIDKEDEERWDQEDIWIKANPNYGISVKTKFLQGKVRDARQSQVTKTDLLTKHLNVWSSSHSKWMDMDTWTASSTDPVPMEKLAGRPCYLGVDLASKKDLTVAITLFRQGDRYLTYGRYYLPEDLVHTRLVGKKSVYNAWAEQGLLHLTPGNVTDLDYIQADIEEIAKKYEIQAVGFDPFQALQLVQNLAKSKIRLIEVKKTVLNFSEPMKLLEQYAMQARLEHNGCPILRWAMSNVVARVDRKGNIYPTKDHEDDKIDPVDALIMAIALDLKKPLPKTKKRKPGVWAL